MREIPQILIVEMDIPVKKRFRQTRYTYIRFRMGIKLFCSDRRHWRGARDHNTSHETPRCISDARSETSVDYTKRHRGPDSRVANH